MRYYHVAGPWYHHGSPLLCWNRLVEEGILTEEDWHWPNAEVGFDGDVVCLFETLEEAHEFAATFSGKMILAVDIPDDHDLGVYELPWGGYISPRLTRVEEGYPAVYHGIPAEWLSRV